MKYNSHRSIKPMFLEQCADCGKKYLPETLGVENCFDCRKKEQINNYFEKNGLSKTNYH